MSCRLPSRSRGRVARPCFSIPTSRLRAADPQAALNATIRERILADPGSREAVAAPGTPYETDEGNRDEDRSCPRNEEQRRMDVKEQENHANRDSPEQDREQDRADGPQSSPRGCVCVGHLHVWSEPTPRLSRSPYACDGAHRPHRRTAPDAAELSPASRRRRPHRPGPEREGRFQGNSPVSAHRQDDRPLLRIHDRSRLPAGVLWPGRPEQHAMADERGREGEGRLGAELLDLPMVSSSEYAPSNERASPRGRACSGPHVGPRLRASRRPEGLGLLQALRDELPVRRLVHRLRQGLPQAAGVRLQGQFIGPRTTARGRSR